MMPRFTGTLASYPARVSFIAYLVLVATGALVLMHPVCHGTPGQPISPLDAVFTSASASCVTGLIVRSTEHDFSLVGQIVILLLIQVGGIGIMTVTTFVAVHLGRGQSLRSRVVLSETLGADAGTDLQWILRNVLIMTLAFEAGGFVLLALRNMSELPLSAALWHALFHSVSAFCNAGFALHDDSLTRYQGDLLVNGTVGLLIIAGGIGFPVILDLRSNLRGPKSGLWARLHLHTKIMAIGTIVLIVFGAVSFLILEWDGVLVDVPFGQRLLVAFFHSVTLRTAGFNTVEVASLTNATLFISTLLMAVGGGPCSTAGGFKVSTASVLVLRAWRTARGHSRIDLARRSIPHATVERATTTAIVFSVIAVVALTSLLVIEQSEAPHPESQGLFLDATFEVISALGTVGLSTGMTSRLTDPGRIIVIALMFIGRLGPISVFIALSRSERKEPIEFPSEEPLIG